MDNTKANKMLIDASHPEETRVVVLRNGRVEEFDFESATKRPLRGNIYLAKVTRVEPSLQACFVEYGGNRHGFLAFAEIHPDYYQIPMADRQALLDEEMAAELEAEQEADERAERMAARRNRNDGGQSDRDQPRPFGDAQSIDGDTGADADHRQEDRQAGHVQGDTDAQDRGSDEQAADHHSYATENGDRPGNDNGNGREARTEAEATGLEQRDARLSEDRPQALDHDVADTAARAHHDTHDGHHHNQPEHTDPSSDGRRSEGHGFEGRDSEDREAERHDLEGHASEGHASEGHVLEGHGHIEEVPSVADEQPETISGSGDQPSSGADVSEDMPERPRRPRRRPYKIQEVIKRRQVMLVQVVKEERGTKGAALTTYLSLAGRYTVLMPNTGRGGGISRKITQPQDRKRLKAIATELEVPDGMGLIIRTAGASRSMQEVRRDYEYLMRLWESVRDLTLSSTAPSLVYEEGSLIKRAIRDLYTKEIDEIVVSGKDAHREAQDFMRMLMPSHVRNVIQHERPEPLFSRYPAADRQLTAMFSPTVPLKSGGYLVINQTEALVAIDINSGKSTREFNIEDTALNTNLEAADEIARQLKLRDLAGLIVIDFIDMEEKRNDRAVERRIKEALRFDRARLQVGRISHFGLLEMSRQRMRTGVLEGSTIKCPHCEGTGIVRSVESISLAVLRGMEDFLGRDNRTSINVLTQADVALYILNHKRNYVMDLERRHGIAIALLASDKMQGANFTIERSAAVFRREPERAAVTMNMGFDGSEPPVDEMEDAPALQPYGEPEEVADDGEVEEPRAVRGNGNGERRESRDSRDGRDGSRDGPRESSRDGDGGRGGRRRRRGRGRGRDERGGDERGQNQRGNDRDQPRISALAGEAGPAPDMQQPFSDFDGSLSQELDDAPVTLQPNVLAAEDDTPELINGDGEDAAARTEAAAAAEAERGGKRRRRGRRGGRRAGAEGDVSPDAAADPAVEGSTEASADAAPMNTPEAVAAGADVSSEQPVADEAAVPKTAEADEARVAKKTRATAPAPAADAVLPFETSPEPETFHEPVAVVTEPPPSPRRATAPVTSAPEIVSDAPARPARKGWWKTRMLGQ